MGNVISFILIFLLIWEFLIWRRMTKYRKDLIQLRSAMARYLHRRKQLLKIMQQYAETHDLSFASWDKDTLDIPEEGLTLEELHQQLAKNQILNKRISTVLAEKRWKNAIEQDEELYYTVDEFQELQAIVLKCVSAYNEIYYAFNKSVKNMPTAVVAKILRIRAMEAGHLSI